MLSVFSVTYRQILGTKHNFTEVAMVAAMADVLLVMLLVLVIVVVMVLVVTEYKIQKSIQVEQLATVLLYLTKLSA